uniref:Eva-1 homolog C n=1 Tax=Pundamilia nyererei TaxID=303518 RepID=A0A3B4H883_9CICH
VVRASDKDTQDTLPSVFCLTDYLSRIITSHSAHACDGQPLRLHCPRHSTISIQSAFYGSSEMQLCGVAPHPPLGAHNHSCSAFTALQKLLSECQSHRDCQMPVNHLLFGKDPCPGTTKYLHVDYKCKPTTQPHIKILPTPNSKTMVLRCKPPRALNIYAAVYGRRLGHTDTCPSHLTRPPPFVPQSLLRVADPNIVSLTSSPSVGTEKDLEEPFPKGSRRPDNSGVMMSNSLLTYAYIKEHPEMAALLFTSSVCVGLLLTLLAVSVRVTCRARWVRDHRLAPKPGSPTVKYQEDDEDEDDTDEEEDDHEGTGRSLLSATERKAIYGWEEVTYVSEAAERAERIERREMIMQEIWMNAYLNGSSC